MKSVLHLKDLMYKMDAVQFGMSFSHSLSPFTLALPLPLSPSLSFPFLCLPLSGSFFRSFLLPPSPPLSLSVMNEEPNERTGAGSLHSLSRSFDTFIQRHEPRHIESSTPFQSQTTETSEPGLCALSGPGRLWLSESVHSVFCGGPRSSCGRFPLFQQPKNHRPVLRSVPALT